MTIGDHLHELYRLPAHAFPGPGTPAGRLPEPDSVAWRISADVYDSDESWTAAFTRFCETVDTTRVRALIVGAWEEAYDSDPSDVVEALDTTADKIIPGLSDQQAWPTLRAHLLLMGAQGGDPTYMLFPPDVMYACHVESDVWNTTSERLASSRTTNTTWLAPVVPSVRTSRAK